MPSGQAMEEGVGDTDPEERGEERGGVTPGDPSSVGGGPGGPEELAGADALGGSDADIGRGGD
jgi:hypothetical protein